MDSGIDANGDGQLQASEIDATEYICNGDPGTGTNGQNALIRTSTEAPGANCTDGGIKIEVGLDANDNGVLDTSEVNSAATTYACNGGVGGNGIDSLVASTAEPAGANCATGGTKVEVGLDTNGDGVLDASEVTSTSYVCNGAGGLTGPGGISSVSSGIHASVVSMSTAAGQPISVRFTLKDDRGYPIDINGVYSLNTPINPVFMLAYEETDAIGQLPVKVYTKSGATSTPAIRNPTSYNPRATVPIGSIVENGTGAGDYTYTFPTVDTPSGTNTYLGVQYDATKLDSTHVLWIQVTRQTDLVNTTEGDTFSVTNQPYWFIPSGTGTPVVREVADTDLCNNCHRGFYPEDSTSTSFHGGGRVDARMCVICHNPDRSSSTGPNTAARADVFVHRIHNSKALQPANLFHGIDIGFPRDIRNCDTCHGTAAQGGQSQTRITTVACTSCHDYVKFDGSALDSLGNPFDCTDPVSIDATTGLPKICNHKGGTFANDNACAGCHSPTGGFPTAVYHKQVALPDPNNSFVGRAYLATSPTGATETGNTATYTTATPHTFVAGQTVLVSGVGVSGYNGTLTVVSVPSTTTFTATLTASGLAASGGGFASTGTNSNTNAGYMAATGFVPTGAKVVTYDVSSVDLWTDGAVTRPRIKFRFLQDGVRTDFQTYPAATELWPNFVGSPSAYFVWAVPQDGITAPSDFNASASAYIKNCWNGTASGAGGCTMTFDSTTGYYTVQLTGVQVPANAVMYSGGIGYTYSLGINTNTTLVNTTTQPLTQTNVTGYPYSATTQRGGLIAVAPDKALVGKNAAGVSFTARRVSVDTAKCTTCHSPLGVEPSFHSGQRNDAPTCAWCHNPNRTSSAWSAGSRSFIHGIHGARVRSTVFNWHAVSPTENFAETEFPGALNQCTACHVTNGYNFRATGFATNLANSLWSTVATGTFDTNPATNPSYYTISPYITSGTNYGSGFSYNAASNTTTPAAATTLVTSPITNACTGCHDSSTAIDHMQANGGHFYEARLTAQAPGAPAEQCLLCHGPGRMVDVEAVH